MASRIASMDGALRVPSRGRAYCYVLPCRDEDILKIGFSRDPLDRLQNFHHRYFEFFDIERAFLIETDHVKDARRLERELWQGLEDHRACSPLLVERAAAGHTEWFRGAYAIARSNADHALLRLGYRHHHSLAPWLRERLLADSELMFEWSSKMVDAIDAQRSSNPGYSTKLEYVLRAALDAFAFLGIDTDELVCEAAHDWQRMNASDTRAELARPAWNANGDASA